MRKNISNISKQLLVVMIFLLGSLAGFAQNTITGRVTDSDGSGIPGVTVSVKGTRTATQTNSDGSYSITAPNNANTLVFSSIGFASQEIAINSRASLNLVLSSTNAQLNEVVVIGYGTVRKKDLTGSVATVTAKDFNQGVITTPEQLISGKVAGVSITSNDGAPGSGSTIRIRGGSSLNASNDPLIVIDGMPLSNESVSGVANPLALINPNDIASFSILKDASATAIYGSRASNGVIIITTKKGQKGKPQFTFSSQLSVGSIAKQSPILTADQFRTIVNTYGSTAQKALMGTTNSTNWPNQVYQTAIGTDNNASISGSLKNLPYRLSVGYLNQNGILKTGNLQRVTGGLNLNPSLFNDHLKIDLNVKGSYSKSRFANTDAVWGANQFDPTQSVYSGKGNARYGGYWERLDPSATTGLTALSPKNPLGLLMQKFDIGQSNRLIANAVIDYKVHFLPDLHAIANIGYDYSKGFGVVTTNDSAAFYYKGFTAADGTLHGGSRTQYQRNQNNSYYNFYLNYTKNIDAKNRIEAMAGTEYQDYLTTNYNFKSYAYDTAVTSTPTYPFDKPENRLLSFLGRVNYSYDNTVFLTASFRRDGSSKFAPQNRWGNFPSAAFAWKLNNMSFLKNSKVVSNLKLRLGYGVTGQQDGINDYDYISYYNLSDAKANYQIGNTYYQMYRPGGYYQNRKWEQTTTYNIALDYGFFNDRINGSLEYYYKKTTDLLNQIDQPVLTNFANKIVANVGDMENNGVEFTINVQPIKSKKLTWDVSFNATYNQNKITKLTINSNPSYAGNQYGPISGGTGSTININSVGNARGSFYVYKQIYDQTTGKPIENLYVDFNNDGIMDKYVFKSIDPKMFFGFNTNVSYLKWNAGFSMRANLGNYVYNNVASANGVRSKILFSTYLSNSNTDVLNTNFVGTGDYYYSNYYVQNASFLKMDNIHLGFNLGKLHNSNVNLRFNASVQNVFTITKYTGVDPEISSGIDNNQYPRPRTVVFGASLDF